MNKNRKTRKLNHTIKETTKNETLNKTIREVKTVKPLKPTDAGKTIKEMRSHRI